MLYVTIISFPHKYSFKWRNYENISLYCYSRSRSTRKFRNSCGYYHLQFQWLANAGSLCSLVCV